VTIRLKLAPESCSQTYIDLHTDAGENNLPSPSVKEVTRSTMCQRHTDLSGAYANQKYKVRKK